MVASAKVFGSVVEEFIVVLVGVLVVSFPTNHSYKFLFIGSYNSSSTTIFPSVAIVPGRLAIDRFHENIPSAMSKYLNDHAASNPADNM